MSYPSGPDGRDGTAIRREFAALIRDTEKCVVSNNLAPEDLAPWQDTTRIIRGTDPIHRDRRAQARPLEPGDLEPSRLEAIGLYIIEMEQDSRIRLIQSDPILL